VVLRQPNYKVKAYARPFRMVANNNTDAASTDSIQSSNDDEGDRTTR
jgi:hypothetical protein